MTQVSSVLEIVAVRVSYEADLGGDPIGRSATTFFNRYRDRTDGAITLYQSVSDTLANNRIDHYRTGIYVDDGNVTVVDANELTNCEVGIQYPGGGPVYITNNRIRDCGVGINAYGEDRQLVGNSIIRARGDGIQIGGAELLIQGNVVGSCGGSGLQINGSNGTSFMTVRENTCFGNGGSGIYLSQLTGDGSVSNNIASGNRGWGFTVSGGRLPQLGCNDWFANDLGAVNGMPAVASDLNVDPLFCDLGNGDARLDSASPLLGIAGCGQIGALGVGCAVTATLVRRFTAERTNDGIRIVWELTGSTAAADVRLERSDAADGLAWIRPATDRALDGSTVVELDRGASTDRSYWYRLIAVGSKEPTVIASPIEVGGRAVRFGLEDVAPNPGRGATRISFGLEHDASIEIDVFDILGRVVASPGGGRWTAGSHVVEWDGKARSGGLVPAGVYLLRYAYPGGRDQRTIVRVR